MNLHDKNKINYQHELIKKCLKNDRRAQLTLYNQYAKAMYNLSLNMVHQPEIAEDVMQESFLSAFINLKYFKADVSFGAWLKKIVINKSLDFLKKKKIVFEPIDDNYLPAEFTDKDESLFNENSIKDIKNLIEQLPEGYRTIIKLYLFEGYDHAEIGQILNISASTSRSQYARAKSLLLSKLKKNK
jgi:RNA polymerase sigma-70 factor (ECF subfamily)